MNQELQILEIEEELNARMQEQSVAPFAKRIMGFLENVNGEIDRLQKEDQDNSIACLEGKSYSYAHHVFQNRLQQYLVLKTMIERVVTQWFEASLHEMPKNSHKM